MFTGLIQCVGVLLSARRGSNRSILRIGAQFPGESLILGESISVRGVCLSVTHFSSSFFEADASEETLRRSSLGELRSGSRLNLERALRVGDRLGGHFVQGHVDGTGTVTRVIPRGELREVTVCPGPHLMRYIVEKGSISLDGVSLTVNETGADYFTVMVIPITRDECDGGFFVPGHRVNVEVDILGKYVEKLIGCHSGVMSDTGISGGRASGSLSPEILMRNGFM